MFIVTKKIDSENISKVCRTCLREDNDKMLYLFVGPAESSLGAKLQSLSCLKVFQGDRLPEKMCDKCVIRAESALLFREQCRAADRALRQALMTTASTYDTHIPNTSSGQVAYNQPNPSFDSLQNPFWYSPSSASSFSSSSSYSSTSSTSPPTISSYTFTKPPECESTTEYQKLHVQNQYVCPIDTFNQCTSTIEKPFQCTYCSKCYSSKSKLAGHLRLHTLTNVHQCSICKKTFAFPSYLHEHMKTHCNKRTGQCKFIKFYVEKNFYCCDVCNKQFDNKNSLKVHMKSHEKFKIHRCEICDKSFKQKSNLVEHARTHTKIKPYKCEICDKSFVQSSHLKSHQASHDSIRSFQCNMCGKKFKLSSHLKRHFDSHTASKKYKCNECNQMFSQAFSLKRHLRKKHKQFIT